MDCGARPSFPILDFQPQFSFFEYRYGQRLVEAPF
jgi:hypothetical protein